MNLFAYAALTALGHATLPPITPNALPFSLRFEQMNYANPLPACHAYVAALTRPDRLLVVTGRAAPAGLHLFSSSGNNFPSPNLQAMVIDPAKGLRGSFDVRNLPWSLAEILESSAAQGCYDASSGYLYIAGGYGPGTPDQAPSNYTTFASLIRFNADTVASIIVGPGTDAAKATKIAAQIQTCENTNFAVSGGDLCLVNGTFFLSFGNYVNGMYEAFGGGNFSQTYTCQIAMFKTNPTNFSGSLLAYGTSPTSPDYHRRDANTVLTRDPSTGQTILATFGGVFPPGILGAYSRPIYTNPSNQTPVEASTELRFGSYQCPVIVAYSAKDTATYHTFFGGIGHYFVHQTPSQASAYAKVTAQGRNDGLPFIEDIATYVRKADGTGQEWVWPFAIPVKKPLLPPPTPPSNLRGADARFVPAIGSVIAPDGVVLLDSLKPGKETLAGYIYGGIEAQNPLPLVPNSGTAPATCLYRVWIQAKPTAAINAKYATEAAGTQTPDQKERAANPPAKGGK